MTIPTINTDAAERAERRRDDITVTIETLAGDVPAFFVTRRVTGVCAGCGQSLGSGRPGRVSWVDQGREIGTWDHQHGCGTWNTPIEVSAALGEDDDPEEVVARLVAEVDDTVAEARARIDGRTRARLRQQLADALALLADGADADEVATGSEVDPGVYFDTYARGDQVVEGSWVAWAYAADGETVLEVRQSDL